MPPILITLRERQRPLVIPLNNSRLPVQNKSDLGAIGQHVLERNTDVQSLGGQSLGAIARSPFNSP